MSIFFRGSNVRRIAQSGAAEILLTVQRGFAGLEKLVIVKNLLPEVRQDGSFLQAFLRQMQKAASLHHHNLIDIYDVVHEPSETFVLREYVSGEDLGQVVRALALRRQAIPTAVACRVIAQAAAGLHYAHAAGDPDERSLGLVHGGLTPACILIGYAGETKVLDVGVDQADPRGIHQDPGSRLARQAYRAPEQLVLATVDPRSDVYTLGVLLYELITHQPLFWDAQGNVRDEVLKRVVPPPRTLDGSISRHLEELVMAAIERDPTRRIQSALELQRGLEEVVRRHPAAGAEQDVGAWLSGTLADRRAERLKLERELINESRRPATEGERPLPQAIDTAERQLPSSLVQARAGAKITGLNQAAPALQDRAGPPPVERRRWRVPLAIGATCALFVLAGAIVVLMRERNEGSDSTSTLAADGQRTEARPAAVPSAGSAVNTPASLLVRVLPEGARVLLDGRVVSEDATKEGVLLPVSPNATVRVEAIKDGYVRQATRVQAPRFGTREVALELLPDRPIAAAQATNPRGRGDERRRGSRRRSARVRVTESGRGPARAVRPSRSQRPAANVDPARVEPTRPEGSLAVRFHPDNALVTVDGQEHPGRAPLRLRGLRAGKHEVAVSAPGHRPITRTIELAEGEEQAIEITLPADPPKQLVTVTSSPPGATVRIDGRGYGETPLAAVSLPADRTHRVELSKPGYETWRGTIDLREGRATGALTATLKAKARPPLAPPRTSGPAPEARGFGRVHVASPNLYGEVWVNGKAIGYPPVVASQVPVGAVRVEVRVGNATRRSQQVRVRRDETTRVVLP